MSFRRTSILLFSLLTLAHTATAALLVDPTQPSGSPADVARDGHSGWRLTATQIMPGKRLAVINGTQVAEGSVIGTARVLRIDHAQVRLDAQGEIVTLHLLQSEVKKTR